MGRIYALCDEFGKVRYVGKTIKCLSKRLISHLSESKLSNKTHKQRWVMSMLKNNTKPTILLIGEYSDSLLLKMEIFWIGYLSMLGCQLTNATKGGESIEMTKCIRNKISLSSTGIPKSNKHRTAISEARKKKVALLDSSGSIEKIYESVLDTNIDGYVHSCVGKVCRGERKIHKGKSFIFV